MVEWVTDRQQRDTDCCDPKSIAIDSMQRRHRGQVAFSMTVVPEHSVSSHRAPHVDASAGDALAHSIMDTEISVMQVSDGIQSFIPGTAFPKCTPTSNFQPRNSETRVGNFTSRTACQSAGRQPHRKTALAVTEAQESAMLVRFA